MQRSWRQQLRIWFVPFAVVALAWTIHLLWAAWPQLLADLPRLHVRWLWLVLAGSVLGGYLGFEAFRTLFERLCPGGYGRPSLAHLYFTAQLMKHLPGRVWGIAYQSATGERATLAQWVSVSMVYMALTTGIALWVSAAVVGCLSGIGWSVLALVVGAAIYFGVWRRRPINVLLGLVRRIPGHASKRMADALQPFSDVDARFKWRVLLWFGASWLIYLLAWGGYGMAWPGLHFSDGLFLCALYTLAWFVGYISPVSPSGMGIRELVFVLLAQHFPPDAVAGMAILGRSTLLAVDVILGVLFVSFRRAGQ